MNHTGAEHAINHFFTQRHAQDGRKRTGTACLHFITTCLHEISSWPVRPPSSWSEEDDSDIQFPRLVPWAETSRFSARMKSTFFFQCFSERPYFVRGDCNLQPPGAVFLCGYERSQDKWIHMDRPCARTGLSTVEIDSVDPLVPLIDCRLTVMNSSWKSTMNF